MKLRAVFFAALLSVAPTPAAAEYDCLGKAGVTDEDQGEVALSKLLGAAAGLPKAELQPYFDCAIADLANAPPRYMSQLQSAAGVALLRANHAAPSQHYFREVLELPPAFCTEMNVGVCLTAQAQAGLALGELEAGDLDAAAKHLDAALRTDEQRRAATPFDLRQHAVRLLTGAGDKRAPEFAWREFVLLDRFYQSFLSVLKRSGRSSDDEVLRLEAAQYEIVGLGSAAFSQRASEQRNAERWLATILRTRGSLQDAAAGGWADKEQVYPPEEERAVLLVDSLRQRARELSAQSGRPDLIRRLEAEARYLEGELHGVTIEPPKVAPEAIVGAVAQKLAADQVLIEIVSASGLKWAPGNLTAQRTPERYHALILAPSAKVRAVVLGPVGAIDEAAKRMLAALRNPKADPLTPAKALYQRVWAPLGLGARRVVLAGEGPLQLVPFAALHDGKQYLGERVSLSYVTTGRDLLRRYRSRATRDAIIVAAPDFSAGPAVPARAPALFPIQGKVAPLPGTLREAQAIAPFLRATSPVVGAAATEGFLRELSSPGILHIATHGLFASSATQGGGRALQLALSDDPPPPAPELVDPMRAAALVMAGVERRSRSGEAESDGFFTAADFLKKDLSNTQLVTLSACETGLGDVRAGQGVFGFRRAIMAAGAQSLVTSLWRVDDEATSEFMIAFYRDLAAGRSREEAINCAAAGQRARRNHPYFWAPFILIGRTTPFDSGGTSSAPACRR